MKNLEREPGGENRYGVSRSFADALDDKGDAQDDKGDAQDDKRPPLWGPYLFLRTYFSVLISDFDFGLLNILHTFAAAEERPITGTDAAGCAW